ncbi:ankyrin repeats (3 copies) domain-containing [Cordyceps militaris]|uniref:Ankyrin repeats (3 copies) domain-containing n=1 Tax=Cordyceps militaris TaxID=73501 RepID=A0A2H4S6J5_CORMI|nr:ankyrin repeats (3 copies) domain-containing [Cordyceps militaris]
MHREAPLVAAVQEEWWDEETEIHFHSIGILAEQVHAAIWQSILQRDNEKLREAIAAIPQDERRLTLWFYLAIEARNEAAAALLLSAGADLAQIDCYLGGVVEAPYRAIHKHMLELVGRMWEATAYFPDPRPGGGRMPRNRWLAVAAECGHADMVDAMLRWNTDWDLDCALSWAAYNWHYETIKTLTKGHSYSQTAVQNALSHACDVDREDDFEIGCCDKSTEERRRELAQVIRWLVDAGAEPDKTESASNGWPIVACLHMYPEYAEALKALLEKGATNVRYERRGDRGVLVRVE